jgi:hypothetical protein
MNATDSALFTSWNPVPDLLSWGLTQDSLYDAYDNCTNPNWLLWLLMKEGSTTSDDWIDISTDIATLVLPIYEAAYPNDTKLKDALQSAKDWKKDKTEAKHKKANSDTYSSGASANSIITDIVNFPSVKAITYAAATGPRGEYAGYEDAARVSVATAIADTAGTTTDYANQITAIQNVVKNPFKKNVGSGKKP